MDVLNSLISEKCVFWVGAGISKDSGAPLAEELSNNIIYALSKDDIELQKIIYKENFNKVLTSDSNRQSRILPWEDIPPEIDIQSFLKGKPDMSRSFIRLETVLESLRQCIPDKINSILGNFNQLKPSYFHYFLATAIQKGHHVITTNWDRLIETAGSNKFKVKIWNPKTNEIESDNEDIATDGSGILLKLHGSIDKSLFPINQSGTIEPVAFIHQFTAEAPHIIKQLLKTILSDKLIVFLGYSFSDYFDYEEILQRLDEYNARVYVIKHSDELKDKNTWLPLETHEYPLSSIECSYKAGIEAQTKSFIERIWTTYDYKKQYNDKSNKNITKNIVDILSGCPKDVKLLALCWIFVLSGKAKLAIKYLKKIDLSKVNKQLYWIYVINLSQAYHLDGKLNESLNLIDESIKQINFKKVPLNILIYIVELLDRGCDISLHILSRKHLKFFVNCVLEIHNLPKNSDDIYTKELNVRITQTRKNTDAISKNIPRIFFYITHIIKELPQLSQLPFSRDFFTLNISIYYKRMKAIEEKKMDEVARCYKEYIEMCNIDGGLGTLTDLALYSVGYDINFSEKLLMSGHKVLLSSKDIGSVYAKIKLYSTLSSINLIKFRFFDFKYFVCCWLNALNLFDSRCAKTLWFGRSLIFFIKTLKNYYWLKK